MPGNFICSYLEHTKDFESPGSFWKWSAYSTVSTVLKDKCYLRFGNGLLFPNLYVLFVAESSGHRKNAPVELSQTLSNKIKYVKTISGRATVEALLDELALAETDGATGKVVKSSSATFFAPELSAGIVGDSQGLKTLTDIYDYKINPYNHRLRTGPKFDLHRVVFSMFSASNQDMLIGLFDQSVIKGGFMARTMLILPNEFRPGNSLLKINPEEYQKALKTGFETALTDLQKISQLQGEFKVEGEAVREYDSWYRPFRAEYAERKDSTGLIGRIHAHVLKVAMILTANDLTLCVQKRHVEQAINECLGLVKNYNIFTMNNAKSESGQVAGIVLTELLQAKDYTLSRKTIVRTQWRNFDIDLLDKAMAQASEAGLIRIHQTKEGEYYQLTQQCIDMMK